MTRRRTLLWALPLLLFGGLWAYSLHTLHVIRLSYPRQINGFYSLRSWKMESGIGFFQIRLQDKIPQDFQTARMLQRDAQSNGRPFPHWNFYQESIASKDVPDLFWFSLHRFYMLSSIGPFDEKGNNTGFSVRSLEIPYWIPTLLAAVLLSRALRQRRLAERTPAASTV